MEVTVMYAKRKSADEQHYLIMECRSSGMSDYQWCNEHDINPGIFFYWVKRLFKQ
jgi:transposase-like protein